MYADSKYAETGWFQGAFCAGSVLWGGLKARWRRQARAAVPVDERIAELVRQLQQDGYALLPAYYSAEECRRGCGEIDAMIEAYPDAVQSFGQGADLRVYGAEHASDLARRFHNDDLFHSIGCAYRRGPLANFSTLAAHLVTKPGNLGSGQGWHRDAFHFQYKSMAYLSDVGIDNGPFQILPGSHRPLQVARDSFVGRLDRPPASRISEIQMERLLGHNAGRAKALPGPAGTVILFDSSTIHRGMPIKTGQRYALTNYFYPPSDVSPAMRRQFEPLITA